MTDPGRARKFTPATAAAVVVANMIGTGVFTSLGFQLADIQSGFALLALWVVGGAIALSGALTYAELGAAMPRSGGEYNFVGRIFHPAAGFVSGWISATIGFAAPTALAAITFGTYLASVFDNLSPSWLATALVVVVTAFHVVSRRSSSRFQLAFTAIKVLLIVAFCGAVLWALPEAQPIAFMPTRLGMETLGTGAFAISLIYVNYAYTGWNAATYLSSELEHPQRWLPWVLISGTTMVMVLYVALNYVFLVSTPTAAMTGELEIGYIVAEHVFGSTGGAIMGVVLAALLVSTASAMILAGPRVLQVVGEDLPPLRRLARTNEGGVPVTAILTQSTISILLIATSSFEHILVFAGFTLALNTLVTVGGVFVLRVREPELPRPFRVPGYPFTPLLYLMLTLWTLGFIAWSQPAEALVAGALIVSGLLFYWWATRSA